MILGLRPLSHTLLRTFCHSSFCEECLGSGTGAFSISRSIGHHCRVQREELEEEEEEHNPKAHSWEHLRLKLKIHTAFQKRLQGLLYETP